MSLRKNIKNSFEELIIHSLNELNNYDLKNFYPIKYKKIKIGWIYRENKEYLSDSNYFHLKEREILLTEHLKNKTFFFEKIFKKLLSSKILKTKLREKCPVFLQNATYPNRNFDHKKNFGDNKIFSVERALLSFFGFPAYGIHLNGWRESSDKILFLLAKRSKNLIKFPGMYDNLVGGGQPSQISLQKNLEKESWEEAGISQDYLKNAIFSKAVKYMHTTDNFLSSAIIFIYNLKILKHMKFQNKDGEIENFRYFTIDEIYKLIDNKKLKPNSLLPILDLLVKNKSDYFTKSALKEIKTFLN